MIRHRLSIAVVTLGLVGACRQAEPPAEAQKPSASAAAPFEAPRLGVYVTNETSGDLSVIDATTGTVVGTVPLGKRPRGIAGRHHALRGAERFSAGPARGG
jgi:YVTN family beta-propeller protein